LGYPFRCEYLSVFIIYFVKPWTKDKQGMWIMHIRCQNYYYNTLRFRGLSIIQGVIMFYIIIIFFYNHAKHPRKNTVLKFSRSPGEHGHVYRLILKFRCNVIKLYGVDINHFYRLFDFTWVVSHQCHYRYYCYDCTQCRCENRVYRYDNSRCPLFIYFPN